MAETLNAIAGLSGDISEVLPYLLAVITPCNYDDDTKTLTFKRGGKGIASIYARLPLPSFGTGMKLNRFGLVQQEKNVARCLPLFSGRFEEKSSRLLEMLRSAGYDT